MVEPPDEPDPRSLKDRVLEYVRTTDYVSFAELNRTFDGVFSGGEQALQLRENLFLWVGMTEEGSAVVRELLNSRQVRPHPTTSMLYLIDGLTLKLPVAKRVQAYKAPHWLPVTLRPV